MTNNVRTQLGISQGVLFISCCGERYYKYGIHIKTNDSAFSLTESHVWRRYSEFCWLRKVLKNNYYNDEEINLPSLPGQGLFKNREDPQFIESRRAGLEQFLKTVLSEQLYRSARAMHLFIQTSISISDMEYNLNGKRNDKIVAFRKYIPRRPSYLMAQARSIPSGRSEDRTGLEEVLQQQEEGLEGGCLSPSSSSYRSVLKLSSPSTSAGSTGSSSGGKHVTFSEQVRIITLANAWPATLQGY